MRRGGRRRQQKRVDRRHAARARARLVDRMVVPGHLYFIEQPAPRTGFGVLLPPVVQPAAGGQRAGGGRPQAFGQAQAPAARVQRLGREAGAVEQRPHGVVQRGAFLGAQVHLVRIGQHGLVRAQRQVRQFGQPDRLAVLGLVLRQQGAQAGAQGQAGLGPVAGARSCQASKAVQPCAEVVGFGARGAGLQPDVQRGGALGQQLASSAATGRAGRAPGITISMGGIVVWRWRELRPAAICHRWIRLVLEPHIRGPDFLAVNAIMRSC